MMCHTPPVSRCWSSWSMNQTEFLVLKNSAKHRGGPSDTYKEGALGFGWELVLSFTASHLK